MHLLATGIVSLSLTAGASLLKSHQLSLITAYPFFFLNLVLFLRNSASSREFRGLGILFFCRSQYNSLISPSFPSCEQEHNLPEWNTTLHLIHWLDKVGREELATPPLFLGDAVRSLLRTPKHTDKSSPWHGGERVNQAWRSLSTSPVNKTNSANLVCSLRFIRHYLQDLCAVTACPVMFYTCLVTALPVTQNSSPAASQGRKAILIRENNRGMMDSWILSCGIRTNFRIFFPWVILPPNQRKRKQNEKPNK